ncbi:hypothetical protein K7X08_016668 [Anisodus acutangulus]|uniref:Uncharacterized protein n=1 Tax=Anisodus acutangulus TaxID=402998 RepID=A0A9Q1LHR6_9SOLA|nr:hypothetical protein K7X08_016668 [Anisodus acutangulus]
MIDVSKTDVVCRMQPWMSKNMRSGRQSDKIMWESASGEYQISFLGRLRVSSSLHFRRLRWRKVRGK